jgi:hypothetical protein
MKPAVATFQIGPLGVFHTACTVQHFYNHALRVRLKKLLYHTYVSADIFLQVLHKFQRVFQTTSGSRWQFQKRNGLCEAVLRLCATAIPKRPTEASSARPAAGCKGYATSSYNGRGRWLLLVKANGSILVLVVWGSLIGIRGTV